MLETVFGVRGLHQATKIQIQIGCQFEEKLSSEVAIVNKFIGLNDYNQSCFTRSNQRLFLAKKNMISYIYFVRQNKGSNSQV